MILMEPDFGVGFGWTMHQRAALSKEEYAVVASAFAANDALLHSCVMTLDASEIDRKARFYGAGEEYAYRISLLLRRRELFNPVFFQMRHDGFFIVSYAAVGISESGIQEHENNIYQSVFGGDSGTNHYIYDMNPKKRPGIWHYIKNAGDSFPVERLNYDVIQSIYNRSGFVYVKGNLSILFERRPVLLFTCAADGIMRKSAVSTSIVNDTILADNTSHKLIKQAIERHIRMYESGAMGCCIVPVVTQAYAYIAYSLAKNGVPTICVTAGQNNEIRFNSNYASSMVCQVSEIWPYRIIGITPAKKLRMLALSKEMEKAMAS
jgi:hypothetical protein